MQIHLSLNFYKEQEKEGYDPDVILLITKGEIVFDQLVAIFDLWDRYKKWRTGRVNPLTETVTTRFVRLFEEHGVHRNQIPRFFDQGIQLQDIQSDASLLLKLDDHVLDAACTLFAVRREWLDGAEPQAHPHHYFYKEPQDFVRFISDLKEKNPTGRITGVLVAPTEKDRRAEALLILEESIGRIGEKIIHRYHLCDNWPLSYWKARAYLAACVAIAWRNEVYVHGVYAPQKQIETLSIGETLLGWEGEGIYSLGGRQWYPEDMALRPDTFLKDLDPEQNNFGVLAGLRLWLDLEQQGFMNTGLGKDARVLFQQELAKTQSRQPSRHV